MNDLMFIDNRCRLIKRDSTSSASAVVGFIFPRKLMKCQTVLLKNCDDNVTMLNPTVQAFPRIDCINVP